MFTNNNFYGKINGKTINDFKIEKKAYKLQNSDERIEYINGLIGMHKIGDIEFYDKYLEELFTQTTDMPLDKDGIYIIEENNEEVYVDYNDYIAWCKKIDVDPLEYAEITNPFNKIDGNETNGEWKYTGANTSNVKLVINKSDSIYSESNIALALERLGSYILNSPIHIVDDKEVKKRENTKYRIYDSKELFSRACKEYNYINDFARSNGMQSMLSSDRMNGETFPIFQPHKQNFNKVKNVKFLGVSDFKKYPILECYSELHTYLKEKLKDEKLDSNTRNKIAYVIKGVREDLDDVKNAVMQPIVFKSPLTPTTDSHCVDLEMPFENEIMAMLQYNYDSIDDTDLICCMLDLHNAINRCKFTDRQAEVLELWMKNYNQDDIVKSLKIDDRQVSRTLSSVCKIISKKYIEDYEDWMGLNYKKSEWKICSRCDEGKLLQRFNKNARRKDGFESFCNLCQRK